MEGGGLIPVAQAALSGDASETPSRPLERSEDGCFGMARDRGGTAAAAAAAAAPCARSRRSTCEETLRPKSTGDGLEGEAWPGRAPRCPAAQVEPLPRGGPGVAARDGPPTSRGGPTRGAGRTDRFGGRGEEAPAEEVAGEGKGATLGPPNVATTPFEAATAGEERRGEEPSLSAARWPTSGVRPGSGAGEAGARPPRREAVE